MSKLFDIIKDKSIESIIEKIVSLLLILFVILLLSLRNILLYLLQDVSKELLLISSLMLLSLSLLLVSYIIRLRKKFEIELKFALGAYWDKKLNPYCPNCKKPLTNYGEYEFNRVFSPGYKCMSCKEVVRLYDGEKKYLGIDDAKNIIREKNLLNK